MHPQLGAVGIVDLLEADPRPTFIVDKTKATDASLQGSVVAYYNPALAACDDLVGLLGDARTEHAALWEWITSSFRATSPTRVRSSSSSESPASSFYYLNAQWSKCLVQQRWLVVGANEQPSLADRPRKVRLDSQKGSFGVSGSANTVAADPSRHAAAAAAAGSTAVPSLSSGSPLMSVDSAWITTESTHDQEPYLNVVATLDWAATPLGPLESWSPLLRQTFQQILADTRPIAMYWGPQYVLLYNEAFSKLCKLPQPGILGKAVEAAWPDFGARLRSIMDMASLKPRTIFDNEWPSFTLRDHANLEELHIKWTMVPITEHDRVVGFLHPILDTTSVRLWERRTKMLIDLGDALVAVKTVPMFWPRLIEALEDVSPQYDVPLAAVYSVHTENQSFGDRFTHSAKTCRFEGGLGVSEGHCLATKVVSLEDGKHDLGPIFQRGLYSQQPLLLQIDDGSLPQKLVSGLHWRGFGLPCRSVIVFPVRPNQGEHARGFLILGVNPRRPYDADYRQFVSLMKQKLTNSLASTILLEEEAKRSSSAVQEAAYEQAQLEAKLADRTREATESERKFEAITDFIPIGMAFQNAQGLLTYANDAWHRITGNPLRETGPSIALRDFLSYIVREDRPAVVRAYERLDREDNVTFECRLIRRETVNSPPPPMRESPSFEKAGVELQGIDDQAVERHIYAAARAERYPDGKVRQILTCLTDVTLHKQTAEEAIRRAHQAENLKRMAELATVGMYEIDLEGKLVEANNVFFEMCGLEKDKVDMNETIVKPWHICVVEEDIHLVETAMNKVVHEGMPQTCEVRLKLPWKVVDSHDTEIVAPRWVHTTFMPVKSSDGTTQSFCGCVNDVSLQKWQLERERLRKEEALESKRQQENFIDMTSHEMRNPLSAIIHCADAVIASLSKALDIAQPTKSLNRQSSSMVNGGMIGGNVRPEDHVLMENSVENAETIIACAQHQKRIVDDILTMSKLDSKLLAVTPITVDPIQISQEALKMFEVEARRVDIDLQMKVDQSYEELGLDYLDLDPSRLKQVLINLLTNALKFTKSGPTRSVTITISASNTKPTDSSCSVQFIPPLQGVEYQQPTNVKNGAPVYLAIEVKDTGQGLTEEEMKTLFQRFKQASARTHVKYGGSGLGLFISRRLCEMHNGAIGVASQPGIGSTFAFYVETYRPSAVALKEAKATARTALQANSLPITKRAESLQIGSVEVPLSSTPNKNLDQLVTSPDLDTEMTFEPPKIEGVLVVEDNMINQQLTRRGLVDRGFTVDVANHGLEALEKLQASTLWLGDTVMADTDDGPVTLTQNAPAFSDPRSQIGNGATTTSDLFTPTITPTKFPLSLILMDVEMPIQDGLTCTQQIRELERQGKILGGHIPIIAATANARLEQILEAKAAGCDDVIIKPYRMPELIEKMRIVAMQVEQKKRQADTLTAVGASTATVEAMDADLATVEETRYPASPPPKAQPQPQQQRQQQQPPPSSQD
ncbi:putative histidine kinase group protein [Coniella lustricola]|uniref:Putative histidine kinase group protein n=1 Tax=Coniella lustricola TaxID=2025994 RepID=A0A2T3AAA1_9PEZI|nr:putative histidine kinase group protein [Coniella lustricola]